MTRSQLTPGIHRVRITDGAGTIEFNLSVVDVCGLKGVAGFLDGQKPPRKGKHLAPSTEVNRWVESMELI